MEPLRLGDRPRFVRPLMDTFDVDVIQRLKPLYYMLGNLDFRVTIAQGAGAVDSLRRLVADLPTLVGATTTEEFLIGYMPGAYGATPPDDLTVLAEWQRIQGKLYRLGLSGWLVGEKPALVDDLEAFRTELVDLFQSGMDELLSPRVAFWAQRRRDAQ